MFGGYGKLAVLLGSGVSEGGWNCASSAEVVLELLSNVVLLLME